MHDHLSDKWIFRFLDMARLISTWSKDPSTQVGAIAVDPMKRNLLSTGYNGFPRSMLDRQAYLQDRGEKYKRTVHGEKNVIYNASFNGISLEGSSLFVHGLPVCPDCALGICQAGIKHVHVDGDIEWKEPWLSRWQDSTEIFDDCKVGWQVWRRA